MFAICAIAIVGASFAFAGDANATCHGPGGIGKGKCTFAGRCGAVYPGETSDCDGDDLNGTVIDEVN